MSMTLEQRVQQQEDILAISELKAAYCNAADGGWDRPTHDYDTVASLFVKDGVWDGGKDLRGEGQDGIRVLFKSFQAWPFAFHRITNPIIKVDGDTAAGEWHVQVGITFDNKKSVWLGGIYNDQFVRTTNGWKFKELKVTFAFRSKNTEGFRVG